MKHSLDICEHMSLIEIHYTDNLPSITGDVNKYFDAFCLDCEEMVFCQTGIVTIPWTTSRNIAFRDTAKDKITVRVN